MLSQNWKILLDYETERNVTKHCLKLFHITTSASTSKLYAYNTSLGNSKTNVSDAKYTVFPDFLRAQNMVQLSTEKLYRNDLRGS